MRAERTRRRPRRPLPYVLVLFAGAALVVLGALGSLSYAINFNLGPLEGLALDASGNLLPEPPIRVALVAGAARAESPAVDPGLELEQWRRLLAEPRYAVTDTGADYLPEDPLETQVVILPWGSRLSAAQGERLGRFLARGGGVMAAGRLELEGASPLEAWFQVTLGPLTSSHGPLEMRPLPGTLVSGALPVGDGPRVHLEPLRSVGVARARTPLAVWETADGAAVAAPGFMPVRAAAMAVGGVEEGRTAWLGFPVSQLHRDQDPGQGMRDALAPMLRWLAGRPVVTIQPETEGRLTPVGLAITVDDEDGAFELARRLEQRRLRPTWFVPDTLADQQPALLERLSATGEVALRGPLVLSSLSPADQQLRLLEAASAFQGHFGQGALGYLPPRGDDDPTVRESLHRVGFDYLLAERGTPRRSPSMLTGRGGPPLVMLPPPVLDLDASEAAPGVGGIPLEARILQALPSPGTGGVAIVRVSSLSALTGGLPSRLDGLLELLGDRARFHVEPLGRLAGAFRARTSIRIFGQQLRADRLHLRLNGGTVPLEPARLRLFLPGRRQPRAIATHHLRPASVKMRPAGDGVAELRFDRIEADRIEDFFLTLP